MVFSPRFPGPLVFSFTFPCDVTNSLLDRLVGRLTGLGVIMLVCPSTCCCFTPTVLSGLVAIATLGAPGVEDLNGPMPGVTEDREERELLIGGGAGAGDGVWVVAWEEAGERRTTWGEENSSNLAATPAGAGLGDRPIIPKLGLNEPMLLLDCFPIILLVFGLK